MFLRHLCWLHSCGLPTRHDSIGELGPGDTIGISLMGLLLGARRVEALDVVRYANNTRNARILADLVGLLRERAPIPDAREFPEVYPRLPDYGLPSFLDDASRSAATDPGRIEAIGAALRGERSDLGIQYYVPWQECWARTSPGVALVISQAALEHVEDIETVHRSLAAGLRIGGLVSHVIDFKSHDMTANWDGHLQYGNLTWRLVKGRRPYLLNRRSPPITCAPWQPRDSRSCAPGARSCRHDPHPHSRPAATLSRLGDEDRATTTMVVIGKRIR